jgi:EmrB/QacA subfamily drug resistance transporter
MISSLHAAATLSPGRRRVVLLTLCLAAFTINLDTTIVNVTLPTLVRDLDASTRQLQWIVDSYNLVFAALVLAAGSVSDRFGRKGALLTGLGIFAAGSVLGSRASSPGQLIALRGVIGLGAAIIFPTTLSILTNVFTERSARAKAIGVWGAMTGVGVAAGPIVGGWLLEHFWWGSVFLAVVPVAAVVAVMTVLWVPSSRDPNTPRLDLVGLALSTAMIGTLVFTIIEAPEVGWLAGRSLAGFIVAAGLLVVFVRWERHIAQPMLDVDLFRNRRFTAASGSVTISFFALFGFIFMVTQYFQFLKGYSPFSTGLRLLPVAISVGAASIIGTKLAVRLGNKAIVSTGLASMGIAFLWISTASVATPYLELAGQMIVLGVGMGFTSAPATEAIMGVVPKEKAGIGSAINDATRELGGTLGVAVIGSVFASIYAARLALPHGLPQQAAHAARESVGGAFIAAQRVADAGLGSAASLLKDAASRAFFDGFAIGCLVAAGLALLGALLAVVLLPAHPLDVDDATEFFEADTNRDQLTPDRTHLDNWDPRSSIRRPVRRAPTSHATHSGNEHRHDGDRHRVPSDQSDL